MRQYIKTGIQLACKIGNIAPREKAGAPSYQFDRRPNAAFCNVGVYCRDFCDNHHSSSEIRAQMNSPVYTELVKHGTAIAFKGRAALITGKSGSGKSGLALQLIAMGADLIADDRTVLWNENGEVMADSPESIKGRIEARGVGILDMPAAGPARVKLIVDLDREETDRMPPARKIELLGRQIPYIMKSPLPHFPSCILLCLKNERQVS